ncbi:23S rRNA (pseudouridine(1915)-N(3))-methyltransferase RlmH [Acetobacter conturbans]|uniref:Ribosomal RNA large subunit methyltransferase H n=1 Tax=Acetobacter conturbans TaxID=1737472 RepID=A0ABX0JXG0_9PROT|nr:23S rRNA (pseudouridine(1915)-N(3))-methyltransferase RlmH [Acetobacter conturbans]NHN87567.1 23S rRNA (pseudouridine(1915)-N(3))-methyltransferase RlmH [Acetobacter conturbans]
MRLIAVGRMKDAHERALVERYVKRLSPALTITELPDGRGSAGEIKRREAEAMLAALPDRAFVVALDLDGKTPGSEAFSEQITGWLETGRELCFLIGGAEGLDGSVVARADALLSLGSFTWPHMLARIMLVEQLYRARAIASGHPYHRSGRP